jgi:tetratricopeptide (TPR) repeat protein
LDQGNTFFKEKKYVEAVEKYAAVQKLAPDNPTAVKMGYHACEFLVIRALRDTIARRSTSLDQQHRAYDKAMADARSALEGKGPAVPEAAEALEALRTFFPDDQPLADMLRELDATMRGRAVAAKKRKLEEYTAGVGGLYAAAESLVASGDLPGAVEAFEKVIAADPQKQTDFYYKAEDQIRQVKATLASRGKDAYRRGVEAMKAGDYLTARAQFRESLKQDPYNSVASRRLQEAQEKLDQAAAKFWSEAEVYEKSNQLELAIGKYRKVIEYSASPSTSLAQKAKKRIDALIQ